MYSVLNTLSEYAYFYISKNITSYTFLLVSKIVERIPEEATRGVLCKKVFLEISQKFTRKHLCQSLFLIKLQAFIKKETLAQVLSCECCEISKNTFFTEHLWTTASGLQCILKSLS